MSTGKTILLVDDNAALAKIYKSILDGEGYHTELATTCPQALRFLANSQTLPNLILVDFFMPDMSGSDFLLVMKKQLPEAHQRSRIIGFSCLVKSSPLIRDFVESVHKYVPKPMDIHELIEIVETELGPAN